MLVFMCLFLSWYCAHRDLHVLTHSFPTRRSSDLMAQTRRRRAGVGTIGTRPAIKGAQPFDAAGLGFIFLPVPATLSFLPGNSTASRHARSGSKPLTLGQLAATDRKSTRLNSSH